MVQDSPDRRTKQGQGQRNKMKEEGKGYSKIANPARGQLNREKDFFPVPLRTYVRMNIIYSRVWVNRERWPVLLVVS